MTKILIIYSTKDGQTLKICQTLQNDIEQDNNHVTLLSIDDADRLELDSFDKIVIGASIHYGRHNPKIHAFIKRNQALLNSKPNAFFSVNVVARKLEKRQPDTNPYLKKFLKSISWQPKQLAVFAGKIDYPRYNFVDRTVIRMIMWLTKGPTDPNAIVEFTDWDQVRSFAKIITEM
jgi:menaquinone-dependent protoporphyrinogen oxidase